MCSNHYALSLLCVYHYLLCVAYSVQWIFLLTVCSNHYAFNSLCVYYYLLCATYSVQFIVCSVALFADPFPQIFLSGGWELVYWFLGHVLGKVGVYSGVPMHVGHFFRNSRFAVEGLYHYHASLRPESSGFSPINWQRFLQSGVCNWLSSIPDKNTPCCGHKRIGGDGTGIGVTLPRCDIKEIWDPPGGARLVPPSEMRRRDRCCLTLENLTKTQATEIRTTLKGFLEPGLGHEKFSTLAHAVQGVVHLLPPLLQAEVRRCTTKNNMTSTEFNQVRALLKNIVSEHSVTLMVRRGQLGPLKTLLKVFGETNQAEVRRIAFLNWTRTRPRGILWEFSLVLELQLVQGSFRQSTIDALQFLGELHTVNA